MQECRQGVSLRLARHSNPEPNKRNSSPTHSSSKHGRRSVRKSISPFSWDENMGWRNAPTIFWHIFGMPLKSYLLRHLIPIRASLGVCMYTNPACEGLRAYLVCAWFVLGTWLMHSAFRVVLTWVVEAALRDRQTRARLVGMRKGSCLRDALNWEAIRSEKGVTFNKCNEPARQSTVGYLT